MKSFAFIVNPVTIKQLKNSWPALKLVPDFLLAPSLKNLPPFKVLAIKKIRSVQGKEISGYFIISTRLPKETEELREEGVIDRIVGAHHIAERLEAKILGIDARASMLTYKGYSIIKKLKIPFTTGSAFTAWSIFEAIYRIVRVKKLNLKEYTLAVINATNPVGKLCTRKLADYAGKIIVTSPHRDRLEYLKETIANVSPVEVIIEEDANNAVRNANIVINMNDSCKQTFAIGELKPDTILCNLASNNMMNRVKFRQDITVIKTGLVKLPFLDKAGINSELPKNIILASLAETMLLSLEDRFINYSFGEDINPDKLEEIADIAMQHGFEVWLPEAPVL